MQSISLEPDETGFEGRMRDLATSAKRQVPPHARTGGAIACSATASLYAGLTAAPGHLRDPMLRNPDTGVIAALDAMQVALDQLRASLLNPEPFVAGQMVSLKEAARVLNMHERTVRRLAKAGAGVKAGGVWRVDVERLRAR